jgi:hypothetical protein
VIQAVYKNGLISVYSSGNSKGNLIIHDNVKSKESQVLSIFYLNNL